MTVKAGFSPQCPQISHYPEKRGNFCIWTNWQAVQALPPFSPEATGLSLVRPHQIEKSSFEWQPATVSVCQCGHWGRIVCRGSSVAVENEHRVDGKACWRERTQLLVSRPAVGVKLHPMSLNTE